MDHKHFEDMVPLYAVGATDSSERQEFEQHLQEGCGICHKLLKEYEEALSLLPQGLPALEVPSQIKTQIMEKISGGVPQENPQAEQPNVLGYGEWIGGMLFPQFLRPAFTVLLLLVLAGAGFYALSLQSQLEEEIQERQQMAEALDETVARIALLRQQVSAQEQSVRELRDKEKQEQASVVALQERFNHGKAELEQLRVLLSEREQETAFLHQALEQKDNVVRLLLSPNVVVVSLEGLEPSPGSAFLLFDPQRESALFYSFNLPALPRGKVYQLWAIIDKPKSIGTFGLDRGRKGRMLIKNLTNFSSISKFAVSIEPEGGRPEPTGTIHLMGDV